jgi:hypothetical protein
VRKEEVLLRVKEQRNTLNEIGVNEGPTGLVAFCVETANYNRLRKDKGRDRSDRKTMKKT